MISFSTSEIVSYFEFQLLIIPTVHRRDVAFTLPQLSSLLSSASLLSILALQNQKRACILTLEQGGRSGKETI